MNKVILMGRLTREPEIRYTKDDLKMARYTLAVDRKSGKDADFISCVAFSKAADFAEKYLSRGTKIAIVGRVQTGSYENKDGRKVNTFDVIVEDQEFAESKSATQEDKETKASENGFIHIPDGIDDGLPFD